MMGKAGGPGGRGREGLVKSHFNTYNEISVMATSANGDNEGMTQSDRNEEDDD